MENILMHIAREANRTGDAKTLFHALDLLEHLMPIATGRVDALYGLLRRARNGGRWLEGPAAMLAPLEPCCLTESAHQQFKHIER